MISIIISVVACLHSGNYTYHFAAGIETQVLKTNAAAAATDTDTTFATKIPSMYIVTK